MKKAKHDDIDIERITEAAKQYPAELVKAIVLAAPLQAQIQQKIRKRKRESNKRQSSSTTESICEELEQPGFAASEARRVASDLVLEPLSELAWTKALPGYDDARLSAENAMRRIYASTAAACVGFEAGHPESVLLDVFFHNVRNGLIQAEDPEILELLQYAQQVGKTQAYLFIARLADELKNARKRVPGAPQFPPFRALLVATWMHHGFWLMSDDLIARIATTRKMKPDGCNRQTITKIVKELHLVKHRDTARRPIVNGIGKDGILVFREGYPPKN